MLGFRGGLLVTFLGWCLPVQAQPVDYVRDVKPILAKHCVACHGVLQVEGGLRLDVPQLLRRGGDSGVALVPGDPRASRLIQAVTGAEGVTRMPLDEPPLSAEAVDILQRWIAAGAIARDEPEPDDPRKHWAFLRPVRQTPPVVSGVATQNPVDAWLAAAHARHGLTPVAAADRATLLRRVYWDLIGAPPTEDELLRFLADESPDSYERVVDGLLTSPRYGERWARHWMDIWRYSDWYGYQMELRNSTRHVWRWRDWIVEALNADKPYDRMIQEMLAADELDPLNPDALRATGFLTRNYYKFNRDVWLDNTVEHTGKAFLGLTLNCARCHHHKFDPVSQQQYYGFRAIFEPYDVRTDRVPGQTNLDKDGLGRVYDAKLDAPTYVYERGNDKHPLTDRPIPPHVPEFLVGRPLDVAVVTLPPEARYPGLLPFIQAEESQRVQAALETSRRAVETATATWTGTRDRLAPFVDLPADASAPEGAHPTAKPYDVLFREAEAALNLARKQLAFAEADQLAMQASLAADVAKYCHGAEAAPETIALVLAATKADRQRAVCKAEADLAQAEVNLVRAEIPPQKQSTAKPKPQTELVQARDAARQQLVEAQQKLTADGTGYASLTEVYPATSTGRRSALAKWITDRQNPLTARVAVNHVWQRHFGESLVESMFDFGRSGKPPLLPELLDALAVEFMDSGWSFKHLHRTLVTSAAYRRSSTSRDATSDTLHRDPDNHYWWRMTPKRLEGEAVRDAVLFVAEAIDERYGGPELEAGDGLKTQRRSLYYRHAPEKSMEFLSLFDGPSANECYRRAVTVVPQQALALHNSSLSQSMAGLLAEQLSTAVGNGPEADGDFASSAFRRVLSRNPTQTEWQLAVNFLSRDPSATTGDGTATANDWRPRVRTHFVHVLFNHNDFVTVR